MLLLLLITHYSLLIAHCSVAVLFARVSKINKLSTKEKEGLYINETFCAAAGEVRLGVGRGTGTGTPK